MTDLTHVQNVDIARRADPEALAYGLAAAAVVAGKFRRPTLRVRQARLVPEVVLDFTVPLKEEALRLSRALLEETVMVDLAPAAARQIKFGAEPGEADLAPARA
ncbi:hypothetical protein, partial [Deinococcus pimensis]|uniref:hypothetical protein n=1 Tax=Deinococcus pimensis TaxID=309888 RepID=UPI0005EB421F